MFTTEAERYIRKLCRQRSFLLKSNRNKQTKLEMIGMVDFLKRHLDVNNYNDEQMASFLMRHQAKIRKIIPYNQSAERYVQELNHLLARARTILTAHEIHKQAKGTGLLTHSL